MHLAHRYLAAAGFNMKVDDKVLVREPSYLQSACNELGSIDADLRYTLVIFGFGSIKQPPPPPFFFLLSM